MPIIKESREDLKNKWELFLNYLKILWEITDEKKGEIMNVLNDESVDIANLDGLKNKLNLILPGYDFDSLFLKYRKYNVVRFQLKKFFLDSKIFPDWYNYLVDDLVDMLFSFDDNPFDLSSWRSDLENQLRGDDALSRLRLEISDNINLFLDLNFPKESLGNFIYYIACLDSSDYIDNLKLFINAWVKDPVVLSNAWYAIEHYNTEKLKIFLDAWMKDPVDLFELKDNFSSFYVDKLRNNLKLFLDAWVSNPKDIVKLQNLLCWTSEIIKVFLDCWITDADDLLKLSSRINSTSLNIKNILLSLKYIWISSVDDFCKLWKFYLPGRYSLVLPYLSEISNELWIKIDDKFYDLRMVFDEIASDNNVYSKWFLELNVLSFFDRWYSFDDIKKIGEHLEYIKFSNFDFFCNKFPGISIDKLCLLSDLLKSAKIENLELLFDKFDITLDKLINIDFGIFISWNEKNISLILEKFPNIDFDGMVSLSSIVISAVPDSLSFIFQHIPDITIDELNFVDDNGVSFMDVISNAQYNNLVKIFEKYPDIQVGELCSIWNLLSTNNIYSFSSFFDYFWNKKFVELVKDLNFVDDNGLSIWDVISGSNYANLDLIFKTYPNIKVSELYPIYEILSFSKANTLKSFFNHFGPVNLDVLAKELDFHDDNGVSFSDILSNAYSYNLDFIFEKYPNIQIIELFPIYSLLCRANTDSLRSIFNYFWPIDLDDLKNYEKLYLSGICLPENLQFKDNNHNWYLKYFEQVIDLNLSEFVKTKIISDISKLSLSDIDNYLSNMINFCVNGGFSYDEFSNCFDWETIDQDALRLLGYWFEDILVKKTNIVWMLNNSLSSLYPQLNINFNDEESKKILDFVGSIWWINKWYTILVLTMEKMVRDWVNSEDFNTILFDKLENYKKILDMYPEDKIPEWLKISVWLEIEMTNLYIDWYKKATWNNYVNVADNIVKNAKVGIEREWTYEYATKPSTNPIVSLLEIHLLQELNLLDINDMQKLSWNPEGIKYKSRNWTGYHLNMWSDSDIWIDENIQFIQNLCTILPRSWMCNWENVWKINKIANINSKSSKFSVFDASKSSKYVELRTYSVDDVELFEKNVLFNTYAIMWSQAFEKVKFSDFSSLSSITMKLKDDDSISDSESLFEYFENNGLFKDNQDLKSKKIAVEFAFMQICILRTISNYNHNFINHELFWDDLTKNLNTSWQNYFFDLLISDRRETFWFWSEWYSSMVTRRCTNLYDSFNVEKFIWRTEPFSDVETKELLNDLWNNVDEKWIPYVTIWLNKQLLWQLLSVWVEKTQDLQDQINNRMSNIDRIKSYIRMNEKNQNLKIDTQYLYDYFNDKLSLVKFNPYHWINLDFMNKIINLNNFFLKNDDTNANGVLKTTYLDWNQENVGESDRWKLSIFETWWEMRKWYNYYQWWSKDMLLHMTQTIALDYMENVKNILNTDYNDSSVNSEMKIAA